MEKRKSCVTITGSNRPSNEPGVVKAQSNGSSSSTPVMEYCWRQGEHPKKKLVHEGKDETNDKFEHLEEVSKLGIMEEDEQKYINREVDEMARMVLNKEESDREARDAKDDESDTISKTQESG